MKSLFVFFVITFLISNTSFSQKAIKITKAHKHLGENVLVCDSIYSTIASHYTGIYLWYMGQNINGHRLTVRFKPSYIYSSDNKEVKNLKRKIICVEGILSASKDIPEILVDNKSQIKY